MLDDPQDMSAIFPLVEVVLSRVIGHDTGFGQAFSDTYSRSVL